MASFKTHYKVGIFASLLIILPLSIIGIFSIKHALIAFFISVFGSLLPDIDIPNSRVAKSLFIIISIIGAMIIGSYLNIYLKTYIVIIASFILFVFLLKIMPKILLAITFHRGIIHSLPMAILLIFSLSIVCNKYLLLDSFSSWIYGISLGYGFFIHLLLDEMYSVNIAGLRLKKSFGSAIKLYEKKEPFYSLSIYALIIYQLQYLPELNTLINKALELKVFLG